MTSELLAEIKEIAELSLAEPWYEDRFAFEVFKAAISALLLGHQPKAEAQAETKAKFQATWGDENPETIGKLIARLAIVSYAKERFGEAFLDKLKKG